MRSYKKKFYASLITFGSIVTILIFLFIIRCSSFISEGWSRSISRFEQFLNTYIFGWLPISVFELFIIAMIVYIIVWLILTIRHLHRFKLRGSSRYWLNLGIVLSLVFTVYMGTAGMEYNRYPVDVPQHTALIEDTNEYINIGTYFQNDYNEISKQFEYREDGSLIRPYSDEKMKEIVAEEFKRLDSDYYTQVTTQAKQMYIFGWLYREFQITGVAFGPTGEANMNPLVTAGEYPFTMAHEIAHTKGVIREEDANLVAAYICLTSNDPYLRYSGYVYTIYSLQYLVACSNNKEAYKNYVYGFSSQCVNDSKARSEYWKKHDLLGNVSRFFNNLYLMIEGDKGTISYDDNIDIKEEDGKYSVSSYSRYQALYLYIYYDLLNK